ncbi:MAG: DUF2799 domain-containing protein [Betaproteobacteria bacterium]|nr:DUF2799 domain-containing protein [Betaproteobacteria bacterium]
MVPHPTRLVPALILTTLLASCATMSLEECKVANWHEVGQRDGLDGKPLSLLNTRTADCAEANIRVDSAAYIGGRDSGLRTFCRVENAAPFGLKGGVYEGVCPPRIDGEFRRRFQAGHDVHAARAELDRIGNRIQSQEQRLRTLNRDEDRRLRDANKDEDRRRIRRDIDDERRRVRDELRDLDRHLHRARDNLREAEWTLERVQNSR